MNQNHVLENKSVQMLTHKKLLCLFKSYL